MGYFQNTERRNNITSTHLGTCIFMARMDGAHHVHNSAGYNNKLATLANRISL